MILCPFFIIISETPGRARNQVMRRREERKAAMKAQLCLHTRLSLQISSWKVTNSFTFFNISQNLNIWHPTVKKIWEFGRFVGFPPDLWSDVNITTIWNPGISWGDLQWAHFWMKCLNSQILSLTLKIEHSLYSILYFIFFKLRYTHRHLQWIKSKGS